MHILPPRTPKRRTTTNLKIENNWNCQKIELYGSPTSKELKKKHSSRPGRRGRDRQPGPWWRRLITRWQLTKLAVPHFCVNKLGGTTRELDRLCNQEFQHKKIKP